MTKHEELRKQLEEVGKRRFFLAMEDHWTDKMYEVDRELFAKEEELKKLLEEN